MQVLLQVMSHQDNNDECGKKNDCGVWTVGCYLLMERVQEKSPADDGHISAGQNHEYSNPCRQSHEKSNHTTDDRPGHPERKPDKGKQSDEAVLSNFFLMRLGGFLNPVEKSLEPFEDE